MCREMNYFRGRITMDDVGVVLVMCSDIKPCPGGDWAWNSAKPNSVWWGWFHLVMSGLSLHLRRSRTNSQIFFHRPSSTKEQVRKRESEKEFLSLSNFALKASRDLDYSHGTLGTAWGKSLTRTGNCFKDVRGLSDLEPSGTQSDFALLRESSSDGVIGPKSSSPFIIHVLRNINSEYSE